MASTFSRWIEVEPSSGLQNPPRSVQPHQSPTTIELDDLTFGTKYNGPPSLTATDAQPPKTPAEIESSPPAAAVEAVQSLWNPSKNKWRFVSSCFIFVQFGLNDSAPGALLPYFEASYGITYGIVSLVFVANAAGFVSAAFVTNGLHARFGRAWVLALGMAFTVGAYVILVCAPPYPAVVVSFFLVGLGNALALSLLNGFLAGLANATVLLGIGHASYGIGGILGPLLATSIVASGRSWSVFYTITLAMSVLNCVAIYMAFRGMETETAEPLLSGSEREASDAARGTQAATAPANSPRPAASLRSALSSRVVLLGAWFIFAYQGAEVTISGWVLSFLLTSRPHPASQSVSLGYITSGFWGGITLGRLALTAPAQRVGEKTSVFVLLAAASAVQLVVWFVPNIFANAVAVAIVGMLLGPIYPCATVVFSRLMTKEELVPALSIVTALGSSGGAAGPFVTGIIGQRTGAWVLNPVALTLIVAMGACWTALPRVVKRTE